MSFRPSLTEDERQTLIDVMDFALAQLSTDVPLIGGDAAKFAYKVARRKVSALRAKLFPDLYGKQKAETE